MFNIKWCVFLGIGSFCPHMLTFNPGWNSQARKLAAFTDVRELQKRPKAQRIQIASEADESTTGPGCFLVMDPDGKSILLDRHV